MNHEALHDHLAAIDPLLPLAVTILLKRCEHCTCGLANAADGTAHVEWLRTAAERARAWESASVEAVRRDPVILGWFDAADAPVTARREAAPATA